MSSRLLYLRIPQSLWDDIAKEAERYHISFAKAGIAMLERGRTIPEIASTLSPQVPDTMVSST